MLERLKERARTILRATERYTKTDMIYLTKGGSFLGLGQIVSSASAFFLSIAFANLFPKEAYGEYRYIFSVVGVATAFSLTGMDVALSQAVARGFDGTLTKSFRLTFIWTLGTVLALLGTAGYYFLHGNTTLAWGLCIAAISAPLLKSFNLYSSFLLGKKDFSRRTRYGMLYDIIPAAFLAGALFVTNNVLLLLATYFISYTLLSALLYTMTVRRYTPTEPVDLDIKKYSFHLSAINILGTISFQLDKILTFHYLGAAQLAVYSFATGIPQHLRQVQKIVSTLALPRFSVRPLQEIRREIMRKSLYLFLMMGVIVGLYILVAPYIFVFIFPDYIEAVPYSQVFVLGLLFAPGALYQQVLIAHHAKRALYRIQTIGAPIRIGFLLLLIPRFGIWGIIATLFVNEIVRLAIVVYYVHWGKIDPDRSEDNTVSPVLLPE